MGKSEESSFFFFPIIEHPVKNYPYIVISYLNVQLMCIFGSIVLELYSTGEIQFFSY